MDTVAQPLRPSWALLAAAFIVFAACEFGMAGCWCMIALFLKFSPEFSLNASLQIVFGATLLSLIFAWFAYAQYRATFRHDRKAASNITVALIALSILISIAFLDLTAMNSGSGRFDLGWCALFTVFLAIWFTAIMNWRWSSLLRNGRLSAEPFQLRISMAAMLGLMSLLAVQFAIAGLLLRLSPR